MKTIRPGDRGPEVKLLQSVLTKTGYNPGPVDGIFGNSTTQALIQYQRNNGLIPDGIAGPDTWNSLMSFLRGYDIYTIRPGDDFFNIAQRYYTTVNAIITANPGVNPLNLIIGSRITVPYGIDVVFTDIDYTYEIMEIDISGLKARYPFLETGIAGNSVLGRNLYYLRLGRGPVNVFYNASHHSLEWINTPVLMKFAENFLRAFSSGTSIRGYNINQIWQTSSIYLMPMVNPDGVDLVINGLSPDNPYYSQLIEWNTTGLPFSQVWNANIRGVDLNRNYPALWQQAKDQEAQLGITGPGPTRYGGAFPFSEPETIAVADFSRQFNFKLVIAYHTQGRVIYWRFAEYNPPRALQIGEIFSDASGYLLTDTPYAAAYAGYKDWFIQQYNRLGYTFETGIGKNPLPISQFDAIYNNNEEVMLLGPIV